MKMTLTAATLGNSGGRQSHGFKVVKPLWGIRCNHEETGPIEVYADVGIGPPIPPVLYRRDLVTRVPDPALRQGGLPNIPRLVSAPAGTFTPCIGPTQGNDPPAQLDVSQSRLVWRHCGCAKAFFSSSTRRGSADVAYQRIHNILFNIFDLAVAPENLDRNMRLIFGGLLVLSPFRLNGGGVRLRHPSGYVGRRIGTNDDNVLSSSGSGFGWGHS